MVMLSILIPIHNEKANLDPLCRGLKEVLEGLPPLRDPVH